MQKKEIVYVGLSGGVDSSVAALRLKQQGHTVVGVFIKVWQPDFIVCDWEKERLDAMRVAAHLDIPFLTFDAEVAYKEKVADYMIGEYKAGRTPNPDVMCNEHVKFGAFLEFARRSGADKVATGHYAQVKERNGVFHLYRGVDENKDQSYFLWTLSQKQLAHIYFPVGDTRKPKIRNEAKRAQIPTFAKSDSQGICFLGQIDIKEFLSHYVTTEPGPVLNEHGGVIGKHDGALYYTIGQRHGFTTHARGDSSLPYFVIAKDMERNTVTVSNTLPLIDTKNIRLEAINQIGSGFKNSSEAQFRYRQIPFPVETQVIKNEYAMLTVLKKNTELPSVGQSCVLYDGSECLGGGIIS